MEINRWSIDRIPIKSNYRDEFALHKSLARRIGGPTVGFYGWIREGSSAGWSFRGGGWRGKEVTGQGGAIIE
jgi:hypothetical protein